MKKVCAFLVAIMLLQACDMDDQVSTLDTVQSFLIATPVKSNLQEFKEEAVQITEPVPITESGKIYAYKNYIFVNDLYQGFHILENSDPTSPKNIGFIKLEGNNDISIKDDRLFADSYGDLVIMDISDIANISLVQRMENAIYQEFWCTVGWNVDWPTADAFDYGDFDHTKDALTGWEVKEVKMSTSEFQSKYGGGLFLENASFANSSSADAAAASVPTSSTTGQGGSFARFRIVDDYLYAVEWSSINVFDISNLDEPKIRDEVWTNGAVETIFNQGDILFLGGTQGMYIYDISSPDKPTYVSEFTHGRACDPVVVSGGFAFVTLRGSNNCGEVDDGLYIVDVSDLKNPTLRKTYPMSEPFGLGIKEEKLFICDGADGLKVYDKTDVDNLVQLNHFEDINTYDVIPLSKSLLMIGDKVLYQYEYLENEIRLLSAFDLR